jgi:integrase
VLAPGSVELVYRWVSTIFKSAVADRVIAPSPCIRITLPKRVDTEIVPLNVTEVQALAAAVPDRYRALIVFAAGMGMRQGECFGLTVDRVDFLRKQVRVDRQLVAARAGVPEFGPPKTKAGFRTIPMPEVVGGTLAAHLARYHPGPAGLVFTNTLGHPLRRNTAGEMWHRAAAQAGLPEWATFHDLRHFYASLLIARGCSVKVIQRRLGHQSAVETLDTYGHLWPDGDDESCRRPRPRRNEGRLMTIPLDITTQFSTFGFIGDTNTKFPDLALELADLGLLIPMEELGNRVAVQPAPCLGPEGHSSDGPIERRHAPGRGLRRCWGVRLVTPYIHEGPELRLWPRAKVSRREQRQRPEARR